MPKEINKVVLGNTPIIDLTQVNATPSDVVKGYTFHKSDGTVGVGTTVIGASVEIPKIIITGKSINIVPFSTATVTQIEDLLSHHYAGEIDLSKYWKVGESRTVNLSAMEAMSPLTDSYNAQTVTFTILNAGGKELVESIDNRTECAFVVGLSVGIGPGRLDNDLRSPQRWEVLARRTWCNEVFKNALPEDFRNLFKKFKVISSRASNISTPYETEDYFAIPALKEVMGTTTGGESSLNRFSYQYSTNNFLWTRTPYSSEYSTFSYYYTNGISTNNHYGYLDYYYFAPYGVI